MAWSWIWPKPTGELTTRGWQQTLVRVDHDPLRDPTVAQSIVWGRSRLRVTVQKERTERRRMRAGARGRPPRPADCVSAGWIGSCSNSMASLSRLLRSYLKLLF
jgi:hypothetical protein